MIGALVVVFVISAALFVWRYGNHASRVLKRCGVPIVPGALPFVGHATQTMKAKHLGALDYDNIKKFGKVYGVCELRLPLLMVADPDLLKEVLLKQFNRFTDRKRLPLRSWMSLSMVDNRGAEWKRIRHMVTPFFTVAKLKNNLSMMHRPVKCMLQNLWHIYETDNVFEAHSVCSSLSLDIICATAFGLDVDSQNDQNNQLLVILKSLTNINVLSPLLILVSIFPFLSPLLEFFNISMFPSGYLEYFEEVTKQMIDERKSSSQIRPDFIHTMVKAHLEDLEYQKKIATNGDSGADDDFDTKRGLTDREIMAQVLLFFLAGHGTTARSFSMFLYCMALHPQIQDKLYSKIMKEIGDKVPNYESIQKLKYLDMCLNESLRLYPPVFRFDREAAEDVTIGDVLIPKHTLVTVPVWAIHHDPDLWPSPETYDPERFSEESPAHDQFSFLPFGIGLRGCIGSQFAQLELKLAIIEVLRSFKVVTNNRTQIPLQLKHAFFLEPKEGLWLSLEPREISKEL